MKTFNPGSRPALVMERGKAWGFTPNTEVEMPIIMLFLFSQALPLMSPATYLSTVSGPSQKQQW